MEGGEREKERGGERKIVKRRCDSPVSPAVGGMWMVESSSSRTVWVYAVGQQPMTGPDGPGPRPLL